MAATCRHGHGLLGSLGSREKGGSEPRTSPCRLGPVRTAEVWGARTDGAGRAALTTSPTPAQWTPHTRPSRFAGVCQPHGHGPPCCKPWAQPCLPWARSPFKPESMLQWPRAHSHRAAAGQPRSPPATSARTAPPHRPAALGAPWQEQRPAEPQEKPRHTPGLVLPAPGLAGGGWRGGRAWRSAGRLLPGLCCGEEQLPTEQTCCAGGSLPSLGTGGSAPACTGLRCCSASSGAWPVPLLPPALPASSQASMEPSALCHRDRDMFATRHPAELLPDAQQQEGFTAPRQPLGWAWGPHTSMHAPRLGAVG